MCAFIYELCNIPAPKNNAESLGAAGDLVDKYSNLSDYDARQALDLTLTAMDSVIHHAEILGIDPKLADTTSNDPGIKNRNELDQGLSRVEDALDEAQSIHKIFTRLIDTMDQYFYFNQVIITIRNKETNTMTPRFVRGEERLDGFGKSVGFEMGPASGIFNNAITRKADIIVKDIKKEAYRQQIPSWYLDKTAVPFHVKGFAIFPVFVDGKIFIHDLCGLG